MLDWGYKTYTAYKETREGFCASLIFYAYPPPTPQPFFNFYILILRGRASVFVKF